MPATTPSNVALLAAWTVGACLAVATPGWPFPAAPLVILLASAIAWHLANHGIGRPRAARALIAGSVAAFLTALAIAGWASGRTPLSFALGCGTSAILFATLVVLAGGRDSANRA